jgi:hypothetical protein
VQTYPTSNGTLSFEGSAGQLFSITNDLTGSIFSVNDVSGIPSIEVFANGQIDLAPYGGTVISNGRVGIGTSSPTAMLDVSGNVYVGGGADRITISSTVPRVYFDKTGTNPHINFIGGNSGLLSYFADFWNEAPGSGHQWFVDGAERMLINSSGNVGIGTSSPGQRLTVAGTIETTSGGVKYPDGTTQTTGTLAKVDIYSTVGSTTWTKPSWAVTVEVILIGGGGGGGSGRKGATNTVRGGGASGSGGAYSNLTFRASYLGATETVVVGGAGVGGAAQATNSTDGNSGTAGGTSSFGTKLYARFGGGAQGGSATTSAPGTTAWGTFSGGQGTFGGATGTGAPSGVTSGVVLRSSTYGGGSGGGVSATNVVGLGGQGVNSAQGTGLQWRTGGVVVLPTNNSVAGDGPSGTNNNIDEWCGGESGSGGGGSSTGNGGNGGNAGNWGSGGGGGGGATDGVGNSGAGGNGGSGLVVIISRG